MAGPGRRDPSSRNILAASSVSPELTSWGVVAGAVPSLQPGNSESGALLLALRRAAGDFVPWLRHDATARRQILSRMRASI
jgi:hypothetical protein